MVVVEDESNFGVPAIPSLRAIRQRDHSWSRIESLVTGPNRLKMFDRSVRGPLISQAAKASKVSTPQIHRDLWRFYRGGMTRDALLSQFRSVPIGSFQPDGQNKRGVIPIEVKEKKRKNGPALTTTYRDQILKVLRKHAKPNVTKDDLVTRVLEACCARPVLGKDRIIRYKLFPIEQRFTKRQVMRVFYENDKDHSLTKKLFEPDDWDNNIRGSKRRVSREVSGPGLLYEMDWTGVNVSVCTVTNPNVKLPPLKIYFLVDVWSRIIAGFFVTCEGTTWQNASLAVFNAAINKVGFCALYGRTITHAQWPVEGIPFSIRGDRGPEVISDASEVAIRDATIEILTSRKRRARDKAIVENKNGQFKKGLFRRLAGYRNPRSRSKARRRPNTGLLTLHELIGLVIDEILAYNRRPVTFKAMPAAARKAPGLDRTPIGLWNWGMVNCTGGLRKVTSSTLYKHLLPEVDGRITPDGLSANGFLYTASQLERADVFSKARRLGRSAPVKVKIDPGQPIIYYRFGRDYITCKRKDPEFNEYSYEDMAYELATHNAQLRAKEPDQRQKRSDLDAEIRAANARAQSRHAAFNGTPLNSVERSAIQRTERKSTQQHQRSSARTIDHRSSRARRAVSGRHSGDAYKAIESNLLKAIAAANEEATT